MPIGRTDFTNFPIHTSQPGYSVLPSPHRAMRWGGYRYVLTGQSGPPSVNVTGDLDYGRARAEAAAAARAKETARRAGVGDRFMGYVRSHNSGVGAHNRRSMRADDVRGFAKREGVDADLLFQLLARQGVSVYAALGTRR